MSSIANLPYGKILDYWYENLKGHPHRSKFLITKFIEALAFKSKAKNWTSAHQYVPFPESKRYQLSIKPRIALVIPVYVKSDADVQDLEVLFSSIEELEYAPEWVIVVDDQSPKTYQVPAPYITIQNKVNAGPAKARNKGIGVALANGADVIAFTDSDCILRRDWTQQIIFHFQQHQNCAIVSGNTPSKDKHWLGTYHNINGTLNGRKFKHSNRLLYGTTANLAITAEVGRTIQFNERFTDAAGEDIEFCFRANEKGYEINYQEKMIVYHHYGYAEGTFKSWSRFRHQFKKYGKGEQILLREIPQYYAYFNETEEIAVER